MNQLVTNALVAFEAVGLSLYGRSVNAEMIGLWTRALTVRKVDPKFIPEAVEFFIAHAKGFPKPAEFAEKCLELERNSRPAFEMKPAVQDDSVPALPRRKIRTREENIERINRVLAAQAKRRNVAIPDYPSVSEAEDLRRRQIQQLRGS